MSCHFTIANSSDGNNSLNISTTGKLFLTSFLLIYLKGFKPQLSPLNSSQTSLTTHRTTLKLVLTCKSKLFWQMRIWRIVARTPSLSSHRLQPSELSSGTRNLFRKLDSSPSQGAGCEFKSGTWFYPPKKSLLRKFSKLWTLFFFFCFDRCLPAVHINTTCKKDSSVPHELAEGFIVREFPVVLLREGMINILQAPLLRQLGRGLLLYRLLRRQSEQRDNRSN